jgi:hypothetical protein
MNVGRRHSGKVQLVFGYRNQVQARYGRWSRKAARALPTGQPKRAARGTRHRRIVRVRRKEESLSPREVGTKSGHNFLAHFVAASPDAGPDGDAHLAGV